MPFHPNATNPNPIPPMLQHPKTELSFRRRLSAGTSQTNVITADVAKAVEAVNITTNMLAMNKTKSQAQRYDSNYNSVKAVINQHQSFSSFGPKTIGATYNTNTDHLQNEAE